MCKQLGARHVTAVELDEQAAQQAKQNVRNSPWPTAIDVINQDIIEYASDATFDLVISNPPFFDNHLQGQDAARNTARHTDSLSYQQLLTRASALVNESGIVYLLLPTHVAGQVTDIALSLGLHLQRSVNYVPIAGRAAKVCALTYSRVPTNNPIQSSLTIFDGHQQYSDDASNILSPFLLRYLKRNYSA